MHGKMAGSCWSLVEPYCNPYHYRIVVVVGYRRCMRDGGSRDEEIRDETLAVEEAQSFREQRIESLD
jgi:hypothetical protein